MRFRAEPESNGKTAAGFEVPDDLAAALAADAQAKKVLGNAVHSKQSWHVHQVTSAKKERREQPGSRNRATPACHSRS